MSINLLCVINRKTSLPTYKAIPLQKWPCLSAYRPSLQQSGWVWWQFRRGRVWWAQEIWSWCCSQQLYTVNILILLIFVFIKQNTEGWGLPGQFFLINSESNILFKNTTRSWTKQNKTTKQLTDSYLLLKENVERSKTDLNFAHLWVQLLKGR